MRNTLFNNSIFEDLINDFLSIETQAKWKSSKNIAQDLLALFETIPSLNSLNELLFWTQINAIRRKYFKDKDNRIYSTQALVSFYVFLIKEHPELKLFENARTIYPSLLENRAFVTEWLESICSFLTFQPGMQYDAHEQYIFILRGADHLSSKLRSFDYKRVDLSSIRSEFYRKCVFNYTCSEVNRLIHYNPSIYNNPLNLLTELKTSEGYINHHEDYILSSEVEHIRTGLEVRVKNNRRQLQTYMYMLKSFFEWCIDNRLIHTDDLFSDQFRVFTNKEIAPKTKRPEEDHLNILLNASQKKAEENPDKYLVFDTIMRLILTIEIRVESICGLERNCITPLLKPGSYRINYVDKTTHGDLNASTVITARNKERLDKMMSFNEKLLSTAPVELQNSIFIYIPNRKQYVRKADKFSFRLYLKDLCEENNIPMITATKLRKEYMSQVDSFSIKEKKDDEEYKALSGHSHVQTTEKHYASVRVEEYFEQMYLVSLKGRDNTEKEKVVEHIPENLERVGDTTHKCGACNSAECIAKSALPCFLCKDFITSKEFLPVYKMMVDEIDKKIISSQNQHDKEDLTSIKEVLVSFIVELTRL